MLLRKGQQAASATSDKMQEVGRGVRLFRYIITDVTIVICSKLTDFWYACILTGLTGEISRRKLELDEMHPDMSHQ